ncbi:MAG: cob(I)yrinic acid a,c-diamide adenosyltransferase [Desulfomonilaceae bacterium]
MAKGLLIVYTGHGKGKTTAALGLMLRALGHGFKTCVVQFIKGSRTYGELEAVKRFSDLLEFHVVGKGFLWKSKNIKEDQQLAQEGWDFAKHALTSGEFKIVVLDELTYLIKYGFVQEEQILDALRNRASGVHVIVTGRDAPSGLLQMADLVTEMKEIKHPYRSGVKAAKGIEF